MATPLNVLIVEDVESDAALLLLQLRKDGYEVTHERVDTANTMRAALDRHPWDVVISDYSMPQFDAPGALSVLRESKMDIPLIIVSGTIGEDVAVEALHAGANDFLVKGKLARLKPAIERELRERQERAARREVEGALRQTEERYRKIVETTNEGVWMLDAALRTIFVNRRMVAMLGYTKDQMVGKPIHEFLHPQSRADVERDFERRRAGIAGPTEAALLRVDGSELPVLIDSAPMFDAARNYEGALAMVLDISQHKRLEQQLRQAQKMEAIGSLAGGVAHDFNNILSVILSYLGLILDSLKPGDPIRADLEEVWKASESATDLTRQLLAFSRHQMLQPTALDLNQVVLNLEKMLRRLLTEDVELSLLTTHKLGTIHADPSQIEQIVMNLVVNARDAMPKGGKLAIETANVELGLDYAAAHHDVTPGPYVLLAVTDTGTGMDTATQARIFEPFFTTKAKGRGTGLGLSTVFGIVKQSGGHIWVYSESGKGTTFKIYFPRIVTPVATIAPPPPPTTLEGTETILLVEDQEQVRTVVRAILRRRGYNVIEAENGGEALLICEKYPAKIHLLLTDVVMPRMSGRELAERLAPLRPDMKVLYISGYTENAIVHHGVLDAGVSFLQKPLTPESVSLKVRQVLDTPKSRPD